MKSDEDYELRDMTEEDRWNFLATLDDELLKGGVILSEWCSFIVRESDVAFAKGASLASILMAVSGIETYLRSEYGQDSREPLFELIERSILNRELKNDLHRLRKYRNMWVHVSDPWDDQKLLDHPDKYEQELEKMTIVAVKALRYTIYENPWI